MKKEMIEEMEALGFTNEEAQRVLRQKEELDKEPTVTMSIVLGLLFIGALLINYKGITSYIVGSLVGVSTRTRDAYMETAVEEDDTIASLFRQGERR